MPIKFNLIGRILFALAALSWASQAFAQPHPDSDRYEYLYADGKFVDPYASFPSGRERGRWKCFDGKTQVALDCTFVRGGFENFQYIFRSR